MKRFTNYQPTPLADSPTTTDRRWSTVWLGLVTGLIIGIALTPSLSLEHKLCLGLHGICAQTHNIVWGHPATALRP
jgi:hypothetical protein